MYSIRFFLCFLFEIIILQFNFTPLLLTSPQNRFWVFFFSMFRTSYILNTFDITMGEKRFISIVDYVQNPYSYSIIMAQNIYELLFAHILSHRSFLFLYFLLEWVRFLLFRVLVHYFWIFKQFFWFRI